MQLGLSLSLVPSAAILNPYAPPAGLNWNNDVFPLSVDKTNGKYHVLADPREAVSDAIWTGPMIHVDSAVGDDSNSGSGAYYGDFSSAKRTIHAGFTAGNATGTAYRLVVKAGEYASSAFTNNGSVEPNQPVALLAFGGRVKYRTGSFSYTWSLDQGTTYKSNVSAVNRMFRTDILTPEGYYTELVRAADIEACRNSVGTWFKDGIEVYVNIGSAPQAGDIAPMRNFNGARFLTHADDFYIEGFDIEGGITGALHLDAQADRNIVGVDCTFRYSSPSNITAQLDAARVRRTNGLVWFRDCDAGCGAKDGWNFHSDSYPQMQVLLENCTASRNGWNGATSVNSFTTHDDVTAVVIGGTFGANREAGATFHCIEDSRTWALGVIAESADPDGDGVATVFKCSGAARIWLQETVAQATGGETNFAIVANGGQVYKKGHATLAGIEEESEGGSIGSF